ncbi:MAG: hypothetical protein AB7I37_20255 [Pirellulales bacterium]
MNAPVRKSFVGLAAAMRAGALLGCALLFGCALNRPAFMPMSGGPAENPLLVTCGNGEFVFNTVVDCVDDFFTIDREETVRQVGDVVIEGRIDTFPESSSTLLEPWRGDTVTGYDKLEATLQSIRRRCIVRVIPAEQGFLVDVQVFKELEDVRMAEHATAGAATLRHDGSIQRFSQPVSGAPLSVGWIPQGRDVELEQRILLTVLERVAYPPPVVQ